MRGTNGDYLAGFDGSPADHRDCNTGVDNDLVCRRRSVCIFCGIAWNESGHSDRCICSSICCAAVLYKTFGCEVSEHEDDQDQYRGKTARVIVDINNLKSQGQVVINGLEWTARSSDDTVVFKIGDAVTIVGIEGVKLIVEGQKKGD